jgi:hypothetical protein
MAVYKAVLVTWVDSTGAAGWESAGDHREMRAARCVSQGLLLRNDEREVVLTQNVDLSNGNLSHSMAIPRAAVQKVRVLATIEIK